MKKFLKQEPDIVVTPAGHKLTIIPRFCKGCEICISFCPRNVLALDSKTLKVRVLNPERCTGCRLCELYCPDFAIFVETAKKTAKVAVAEGV